jgi:galactokinase
VSFRQHFGRDPVVVVSAPGRVNLIGEHTDYAGLPVLPFAIDRRVTVTAAPGPGLEIVSEAGEPFVGRSQREGWHRYISAVLDVLEHEGGLVATVESDLPSGGGLSSSTALTMALIAAVIGISDRRVDPAEAARLAAVAERNAGVESGEMDQTVIAHGREGNAMRIDFESGQPRFRHVALPAGAAFVVAFSGQPAEKGGAARADYNSRVIGGRVATLLLARRLGIAVPSPVRLGGVAHLTGVTDLAGEFPEELSVTEAARATGVDEPVLARLTRGSFPPDRPVPVRAVAVHVLTEAGRVEQAEVALADGDLDRLGYLLDLSHASLVDFGASTPALDRLVAAMRVAGALGTRLTGAGFGGNAVALCRRSDVAAIVAAALETTGGPAFEVRASAGLRLGP